MNGISEYLKKIRFFTFVFILILALVPGSSLLAQESEDGDNEETEETEEAAQAWKISGYVESENFLMINPNRDESKGDKFFNKIENHALLDLQYGSDDLHGRGVLHGYVYPTGNSGHLSNRLLVNELYIKWLTSLFELKAGRQVIRWGTADAFNATSYFSPMDISEILFKDDDELYLGVDSLSGIVFFGDYTLQLVCMPIVTTSKLPGSGSPWEMRYPNTVIGPFSLPVSFQDADSGIDPDWKNISFGGRFSGTINSLDFSVSGYHGIDRNILLYPTIAYSGVIPTSISLSPIYKKITSFGADFAYAISDFTIQGEGAYSYNKKVVKKDIDTSVPQAQAEIKETGFINFSAGVNWLIDGEDFSVTLEYMRGDYLKNSDDYYDPFFNNLIVGSILKKFLDSSIELELRGMFNTSDRDWLIMPRAKYDFQNGFALEAEGGIFYGDEDELFGVFKSRDIVRLRAKYNF
ncbi:MAG: hypothetical protein GY754_34595 [bacterium]|nr:hypothetical protein [bacterium]